MGRGLTTLFALALCAAARADFDGGDVWSDVIDDVATEEDIDFNERMLESHIMGSGGSGSQGSGYGSGSGSQGSASRPCASDCPVGTCDSAADASKPECAACSKCMATINSPCASACPVGTCDFPADASKTECAACKACIDANSPAPTPTPPTPAPTSASGGHAVGTITVKVPTKLTGFSVLTFTAGVQRAYRLTIAKQASTIVDKVAISNISAGSRRRLGVGDKVDFDVTIAVADAAAATAMTTTVKAISPTALHTELATQLAVVKATGDYTDITNLDVSTTMASVTVAQVTASITTVTVTAAPTPAPTKAAESSSAVGAIVGGIVGACVVGGVVWKMKSGKSSITPS
jgi:hypothetical protein